MPCSLVAYVCGCLCHVQGDFLSISVQQDCARAANEEVQGDFLTTLVCSKTVRVLPMKKFKEMVCSKIVRVLPMKKFKEIF